MYQSVIWLPNWVDTYSTCFSNISIEHSLYVLHQPYCPNDVDDYDDDDDDDDDNDDDDDDGDEDDDDDRLQIRGGWVPTFI